MTINYIAVLVCSVLAMVVGAIWYGPLFGKKWAEVVGTTANDLATRNEVQKRAMPLYVVQFILTLFQVWVFARIVAGSPDALQNLMWIWAAVVVPVLAGTAMWNNDSAKISWARFLIQVGYQFVIFLMFGMILGIWK